MKQIKLILISVILLISIVLTVCSCDLLPQRKKYTGGFHMLPTFYKTTKIYWVETFEEVMEALEHLRAAGNTGPGMGKYCTFDYENETVDAKFCFWLQIDDSYKPNKDQKWYDRKYKSVDYIAYWFLEKVTIEELEYSRCESYDHFRCRGIKEFDDTCVVYYKCERKDGEVNCGFYDTNFQMIFEIEYCIGSKDHWSLLPENFHEDFPKSRVMVGYDEGEQV